MADHRPVPRPRSSYQFFTHVAIRNDFCRPVGICFRGLDMPNVFTPKGRDRLCLELWQSHVHATQHFWPRRLDPCKTHLQSLQQHPDEPEIGSGRKNRPSTAQQLWICRPKRTFYNHKSKPPFSSYHRSSHGRGTCVGLCRTT